jgi:hypothetical protein
VVILYSFSGKPKMIFKKDFSSKKRIMSDEDFGTRLDELTEKVNSILDILSTQKPKGGKKAEKVEQFVTSTEDLLSSGKDLCSYMQKSKDCKGHCGREAKFTVQTTNPIEIDSAQFKKPKDERKGMMRKAFFRCTTCKNKGKNKTQSRAYDKIHQYVYGGDDGDEVIDDALVTVTGTPKEKKSKKKSSKSKKKKDDSDDEVDVEDGLDDPSDENSHLKKTDVFRDTFVKVDKKHNVIIRKFKDKRKKDVVIGEISGEPEDEDYEDELSKPSSSVLKKVELTYKTPEESLSKTPPKASKKAKNPKVKKKKDDSDDDSDGDSDDAGKGFKELVKSDDDSDDD